VIPAPIHLIALAAIIVITCSHLIIASLALLPVQAVQVSVQAVIPVI
jgi:hypothetical protein